MLMVAGEVSGDHYGALIARALLRKMPELELYGIGGDAMSDAGVSLIHHFDSIQASGFSQVIFRYRSIAAILDACKTWVTNQTPSVVILIDSWGFNSRLGRHAKLANAKVFYVIPPKVWAWKKNRVIALRQIADHIAVLFPFEAAFLQSHGCAPVTYAGNPLSHQYAGHQVKKLPPPGQAVNVGLLPGSRSQEIEKHIPLLNQVVEKLQASPAPFSLSFSIPCIPSLRAAIHKYPLHPSITIESGEFCDLLRSYHFCITSSGTAALEVALAKIPQIVFYKTSMLDAFIIKRVITTPWVSLPNILLQDSVIPELIYGNASAAAIADQFMCLLTHNHLRARQEEQLVRLQALLETSRDFGDCCAAIATRLHASNE